MLINSNANQMRIFENNLTLMHMTFSHYFHPDIRKTPVETSSSKDHLAETG